MDHKNPMEILTDAELESEFKMNKNFVDRHAKEMGSRGRPRTFLRMNVERFVLVHYSDRLMDSLAKKAEALRQSELLENLPEPVFQTAPVSHIGIGYGKILGKGGKKRVAA
jgi:hypothetical protein